MALGMAGDASSSTARAISAGSIRVSVSIPVCFGMEATKVSRPTPVVDEDVEARGDGQCRLDEAPRTVRVARSAATKVAPVASSSGVLRRAEAITDLLVRTVLGAVGGTRDAIGSLTR